MKRPFRIEVGQDVLEDIQTRLARFRPAPPREEGWDFGTDPVFLAAMVTHWQTAYDWRTVEAELNRFHHFIADDLHFIRERSSTSDGIPLLLLHGWPDSFYRYDKVIRPLTAAGFDVVVPSLPGFGFSAPLVEAHQPMRQIAQKLYLLMTQELGYSQFGVVGGDGGSPIAQILAIDHPEAILGVHLTDLGWHATQIDPATATKEEAKYLEAGKKLFMTDGAYAAVHAQRPLSLAPSLNDSPVGLASWILDRFHAWSDHGGDLESIFTKDELLTFVMIFWVTQTITPAIHGYFAEAQSPSLTPKSRVETPVALALFPKDIGGVPPRSLAERTLNVQRWTELPDGGHFGAFERPSLFIEDLVAFFSKGAADARAAV